MIRRLYPIFACAALALSGCGTSLSSGVSAGLGAKSLPNITLPAYVPGPLNGESTRRSLALRRPLAVVVENYNPDSRPQSGLAPASTVIETLAEGGVTRFLAIYLEQDAPKVGPVRSTRMYFDHWAAGFHSILAHVGGNDDALALLWHLPPVFSVDENRWERSLSDTGTPLFWRTGDRVPPHNLYTSTYKLRAFAVRNRQNWPYAGASFPHKSLASLRSRGRAQQIDISFRDPLNAQDQPGYDVRYVFDRRTDTYSRFMGGPPHIDANTGKQLRPSTVVIMRTRDATPDPYAGIATVGSILIPTLGQGPACIYRDGTVLRGLWRQHDQFAPLVFTDRRGHPAAFNPGQTWIEVVPASSTSPCA